MLITPLQGVPPARFEAFSRSLSSRRGPATGTVANAVVDMAKPPRGERSLVGGQFT